MSWLLLCSLGVTGCVEAPSDRPEEGSEFDSGGTSSDDTDSEDDTRDSSDDAGGAANDDTDDGQEGDSDDPEVTDESSTADDTGEDSGDAGLNDEVDGSTTPDPEQHDSGDSTDDTSTDEMGTDDTAEDDVATDETSSDDTETDDVTTDEMGTDDTATDDVATDETSSDDTETDETVTDDETDDTTTDETATDDLVTDDPGIEPGIDSPVTGDGRGVTLPLVLQVTSATQVAVPGERQLYFITVGNASSEDVEGVTVQLRVPDGIRFHYINAAEPNSAACAGLAQCTANLEANWNLGTILAQSSRTIEINAEVLDTVADGDTIDATVLLNAPGLSTLSVSKSVQVRALRELELALTTEHDPVVPGQTAELVIDVGQIGTVPVTSATLGLELPGGLCPTQVSAGGTASACSDSGVTVSWPTFDMGIGETGRRTVTVEVAEDAAPGGVFNPRATLTYSTGTAKSETAQLPISVVPELAPLSLTVAAEASPGVAGEQIRYVATVANRGLRDIAATSLWYRQPRELQHHYINAALPNHGACAGLAQCSDGLEVGWALGNIPAGTTQRFEVAPTVLDAISSGALVTSYFTLVAPEQAPARSSLTVPVNATPEAQLHLGHSGGPVTAGGSLTYELHVGQVGNAPLANTTLLLELPPGVTVSDISEGGTETSEGVIQWDLGTVAVAGYVARSATVTLGSNLTVGTALKAFSSLEFGGGSPLDAQAETVVSVVSALPVLTATMTNPASVTLGEKLRLQTTVTNTSARAVDGVTVTMRVPPGLQFHYLNDVDPNSAACAGLAQCSAGLESVVTLGTMAAGQSLLVDVNANTLATGENAIAPGTLISVEQWVTATGLAEPVVIQSTVATD